MSLDQVKRVKREHELELLQHDFVEGVGVGELRGSPAIMIYVDHDTPDASEVLPDAIEGVPVVVEVSGPFKAF
jgi:hypothetical protein